MPDREPQTSLLSSRHRRVIILSLILAAVLYLTVVVVTGFEQAISAFQSIGISGWLMLFTASLANYSLRYIRWQYYLRSAGLNLGHNLHFRYYLSAFALTTTPGKMGEIIRSVLLRPHGIPYHTSLACFFTERFLDLIVVAIIAMFALLHFSDYNTFILIFIITLTGLLPVIRSKFILALLGNWQHKLGKTRLGHFLGHGIILLKNAHIFLAPKSLYTGLLIGLLAWSLQGFAFYFILHTLGYETSLTIALGIYAVSLLAGAASFIPGGIGSTELMMGLLLIVSGADKSIAITAPIISRLSTLWFAVVVGLLSAGSLGLHRQQQTVNRTTTESE